MAEDKPTLHIDTDWKKQAQEEKKRLAEQAAAHPKEALASPSSIAGAPAAAPRGAAGRSRPRDGAAEVPQASFAALVQSLMTQVFFYLGELASRGGEAMINFD